MAVEWVNHYIKNVTNKFDVTLAEEYYEFIEPGGDPIVVNGTETAV